jgi:hypothetical protein
MLKDKLSPLGPDNATATTRLTANERFYSLPVCSSLVWISAPPTRYTALHIIVQYALRVACRSMQDSYIS